MNSQFVDAFLQRSSIKIGTAEEYRRADATTGARSDSTEAIEVWNPGASTHIIDKEHPFAKRYPKYAQRPKPLTIAFEEGAKVIISQRCHDIF
jgi:hypothetical protein